MELSQTIEVPSRRFGRYVVRSRLGAGGMAEVFLSQITDESGHPRDVALKLMKKGVDAEAFADEADLMGLLSHPNLVQRLEFGEAFGRPFIAMEFLMAGDLRALLQTVRREGGDVPLKFTMHVTIEVLKALAYFHQAKTRTGRPLGLVHGDVNPSNIFFSSDGDVKLGDYGVAKSKDAEVGPRGGATGGKLRYLAPELFRGEQMTPKSDLFALGVMLFELAVGYHPFDKGEDADEKVAALMKAAKLPVIPERVPKELHPILHKALAEKASQRYATAGDMASDLFRYVLNSDQWMARGDIRAYLEEVVGILGE